MWGNPTKKDEQQLASFVKKINVEYIRNEMQLDDYIIGKQFKSIFVILLREN